MLIYDDLARACRENDTEAEKSDPMLGASDTMQSLGCSAVGAAGVAEQRGLRALMFYRDVKPDESGRFHLSQQERADLILLQAAVFDGIAIGLRAARNEVQERLENAMKEMAKPPSDDEFWGNGLSH
jgi:hypothetical protein